MIFHFSLLLYSFFISEKYKKLYKALKMDSADIEKLYIPLKKLTHEPRTALDVLFGQRWMDDSFPSPDTISIETMLNMFLEKSNARYYYKIFKIKHDGDPVPQLYVCPTDFDEQTDGKTLDKIHIVFRMDGLPFVLNRLFAHLQSLYIKFKIVSPYPLGYYREWTPFPYIKGSDSEMNYGDLSKTDPLTPNDIYRAPILYKKRNDYMYDGKSYLFEHVFTPTLVCYVPDDRTKNVLDILLRLFSDADPSFDRFRMPNYYPRFNVKINNMIYIGIGEGYDKMHFGGKTNPCSDDKGRLVCRKVDPEENPYTIPIEYKAIQDQCDTINTKEVCDDVNRLPHIVSHSTLCKWKDDTCQVNPIFSPNLLVSKKDPSLKHLYERIGQSRLWDEWNSEDDVVFKPLGVRKSRKGVLPRFVKKRRSKKM